MRVRIDPMIAIPAPIERPHEVAAIWAITAINLVVALAIHIARIWL
jgi:hypothetical protein